MTNRKREETENRQTSRGIERKRERKKEKEKKGGRE